MNLSFSTRGWNSLSWDQQVLDAEEMGFQGIEAYNIQDFPSLSGRGGAFHAYNLNETLRSLKKSKLSIPCFDTSIDISQPQDSTEKTDYLLQTASAMKVRYIAFCALRDDEETIRGNVSSLLEKTGEEITILIQTVGIYANILRRCGICIILSGIITKTLTRPSATSADMSSTSTCAILTTTSAIT